MSKLSNKRKNPSEGRGSPELQPLTPDYERDNRQKLQGKRRKLNKNSDRSDKKQDESNDTPQMRALKEKMMQRQTKGNATKRSKIIKNPEIKDSPKHDSISPNGEINKYGGMTPQMRILQARVQMRKSFGVASVPKEKQPNLPSKSVVDSSKQILKRGKRAKSMGTASLSTQSETSVDSKNDTSCNNQQSCAQSTQPPTKKSRSCVINEKLKLIRTEEAPPGVASKRIIVKDDTATELELNHYDLSLDLALTSSSSSVVSAETPVKKTHQSAAYSTDYNIGNTTKKKLNESPPNIYKNANERLRSLRERLVKESQISAEICQLESSQKSDSTVETSVNTENTNCEEMEWEPIEEDRIFYEIQSVRAQLNFEQIEDVTMHEIAGNTLSLNDEPDGKKVDHRTLYIVIDTNVLLTDLKIVEKVRDTIFKCYGRPIIVIPWTTIRELDFIKDDKTNIHADGLKFKARQAIRFLSQHFSAKHPRVLGQTPQDVAINKRKFYIECPDDEILQTCLQVYASKNNVVLLSYDRNLCNKAMIHNITTIGRNDSFEKIDLTTESDCKNESCLAANLKITGKGSNESQSPLIKELAIAENLYEETKTVLTSFLTIIVAKEMGNLFGDNWERYTIIKPPWSTIDVLKCAIKHWLAAVSDSFTRRAELILKELCETIEKLQFNRRLNDIENIIQSCFELVQCLRVDKHSNLLIKFSAAIDELKKKHQEALKAIQEYQVSDEFCLGISRKEQESKAEAAFCCFMRVFDNARDLCGIAAKSIGMSCTFFYNQTNNQLGIEDIKNRRPEIAANVNRLLLTLSTTLEDVRQLTINHRYVVALYNALDTLHDSLLLDIDGPLADMLSPTDIYFCLKHREKSLKACVRQCQELSSHFCRMASSQIL